MANELYLSGDPSTETGLTITAKVYTLLGVQVGSDVTCTEVGTLGYYLGDMPSAGAGDYLVRFFSGATFKGEEVISWDGTERITLETLAGQIDAVLSDIADTDTLVSALNDLTPQQVRDAMALNHTNGTAGVDKFLRGLQALVIRR